MSSRTRDGCTRLCQLVWIFDVVLPRTNQMYLYPASFFYDISKVKSWCKPLIGAITRNNGIACRLDEM